MFPQIHSPTAHYARVYSHTGHYVSTDSQPHSSLCFHRCIAPHLIMFPQVRRNSSLTRGGRASCLGACFDAMLLSQSCSNPNLLECTHSVDGQLRGDKECPSGGVTSSGRVWRKVPENHRAMFTQLYVSTAVLSHMSMFPQLCNPTALCSYSCIVSRLCVPTAV